MYSLAEAVSVKADWGHPATWSVSSYAWRRQPGGLFHHEPMHDDKQLSRLEAETRRLEQITRAASGRSTSFRPTTDQYPL